MLPTTVRFREERIVLIIGRCVTLAALILAPSIASAQQIEDRLVIVTSVAEELTAPFAPAFEKNHPGTRLEGQNRNSAAALPFIRETRASPPDIFWASPPDACD